MVDKSCLFFASTFWKKLQKFLDSKRQIKMPISAFLFDAYLYLTLTAKWKGS